MKNIKEQTQLPGINIPAYIADFSTISLPKYWGGKVIKSSIDPNDLYIEPITSNIDEAIASKPVEVDNIEMDAFHAISIYNKIVDELETEHLWLRTPDLQGVLNTAGMILKQEEF